MLGQVYLSSSRNCMRVAEADSSFYPKTWVMLSILPLLPASWNGRAEEDEAQKANNWPKVHSEEAEKTASWTSALKQKQNTQTSEHYRSRAGGKQHTSNLKNEGPEITLPRKEDLSKHMKLRCPLSAVKAKSPCFPWGRGWREAVYRLQEGVCTNSCKRGCIPACSQGTC